MNQLTQLTDFQTALASYTPSAEARAMLADTNLVLLVGPSSSGRNTIMNELAKSGRYYLVVSDTTRQPRVKDGNVTEENGREYWFRPETDILRDVQAGAFLEAAIIHNQQVSGISIRVLTEAAREDKIAITDIEIMGAETIHGVKPDALLLFVLPPSFDEWMARMSFRSVLPSDEVRRRLESAVEEITIALGRDYYQFVVNDTFMHTARHIDELIVSGQHSDEQQTAGRAVAADLLRDTQRFLLHN